MYSINAITRKCSQRVMPLDSGTIDAIDQKVGIFVKGSTGKMRSEGGAARKRNKQEQETDTRKRELTRLWLPAEFANVPMLP